MPLHVARLRDSDLAAEEDAEACWFALLLWAASWHQIPAASIPDNDVVLMRLVGLGRDAKTWKRVKAGAMRGFILCSDGRYYHPVVAEQALQAWGGRVTFQTERSAAAERQARWREDQKKMCARLRELGITPPEKASKATLNALLETHDPLHVAEGDRVTGAEKRHENERHAVTDPVTPVTPKRGTGTGTGIIEEEAVVVSAGEIAPAGDEFSSDLFGLTDRICRAGGVRHIDPGQIAKHTQLVKGWIAEGFDPDLDIVQAVTDAVTGATERINSLLFFDRSIRQHHARRKAAANGNVPRNPARRNRSAEIDDAARDLGFE
jgi:hypothetical protein